MSDKIKNHWWILIILALAQFMVVLDTSVVNVALPAIQRAFHMPQANLQWLVTAYTLTFGGLLVFGGRAADLFGRKRLFMIGVVLFGFVSFLDGFFTIWWYVDCYAGCPGIGGCTYVSGGIIHCPGDV